ncbi:MAG: hypothetical protein H6811_04440 [Phycisphaeraceae bacterium]|nr:hypothetical protein [Phycisphaeraceae bacterium]
MAWIRFEVLGAERETGTPRRLVVEALSARDAENYAIEQGLLVSRIEQADEGVAPEPPREGMARGNGPGADETDERLGPDSLRFGTRRLPMIHLEPGEAVISEYAARGFEIGFFAIVFGERRRLVLTDRRLIAHSKTSAGHSLQIGRLVDLDTTRVETHMSPWMFICGLSLALTGAFGIGAVALASAGRGILGGQSLIQMPGTTMQDYLTPVALMVVGALMAFVFAFKKRLGASSASSFLGITCRKLDPRRMQSFIDALDLAERTARRRETGTGGGSP